MAETLETAQAPVPRAAQASPSLVRRVRLAASGVGAAFLGLLPHILHHAGPLAGAALFAGVGGSLLFGALGLLAAIPFLVRMRRHCGSWRRPLATLALFAAVFSLSTFVIGPALTGGDDGSGSSSQGRGPANPSGAPGAHEGHH